MNTSNRTETTGKRDVRRETTARILTVDARIEAIRMQVRDTHPELLQDVDQARLQMLAQRRIAARDRSTLPALRAAGDEAERIGEALYALIQAAMQPVARVTSRAPRGRRTEVRTVVYGEGESVQVVMITYPVYRYDVVVNGTVIHSIKATRAWRTERKAAIAQAQTIA
jgi:hypothetical protein